MVSQSCADLDDKCNVGFHITMQVQQQMAVLATNGRRAALTVEELATVPDSAKTYRTVGRA